MTKYTNFEEYVNSPDYTFDQLAGSVVEIDFGDGTSYKRYTDGDQCWYKNDQLHRDGDQPAVIRADGTRVWYKDGQRHRDGDLPALIWRDGTQTWYKNDQRHRDGDLPALIWADGTQRWFKHGKEYTPKRT